MAVAVAVPVAGVFAVPVPAVFSRPLPGAVTVRWSLAAICTMPVSPGPGRRALRLGLAEDGGRAGGAATVPLAECRGGADGSARAGCRLNAAPTVTASTTVMSPAIAAQARTGTGLRRRRRAPVRARDAGRDAAGPCHRAPSATPADAIAVRRRNRGRGGRGIGHAARAGDEIVPQVLAQPACPLRDLGGAARSPGRILGDELQHQGAHIGRYRSGQRRHCVVAVRAPHVRRLAHEGRCPGQAFVRDDSQCIQVTGRRGLSLRLSALAPGIPPSRSRSR